MVQRKGGMRRKTRHKLRKSPRQRGKVAIAQYLQQLKEGEKVILKIDPSIHKGMFFPRFHGKIGTVHEKKGSCYKVAIKDGNKAKTLIVHPIHMRKI